MKSLLKCMAMALVVGLVFYGFDAFAADEKQIWTNAFNTMVRVFKNVRTIVYVIGAFGLIGIAVGAIMGKLQFKWLAYLAAGLAIVAVADLIIRFATQAGTSTTTSPDADIKIDGVDWNN